MKEMNVLTSEEVRLKEICEKELDEKFGIPNQSAFFSELRSGRVTQPKKWLEHIQENRSRFPKSIFSDEWLKNRWEEVFDSDFFS